VSEHHPIGTIVTVAGAYWRITKKWSIGVWLAGVDSMSHIFYSRSPHQEWALDAGTAVPEDEVPDWVWADIAKRTLLDG
jgi:hypothetical protein